MTEIIWLDAEIIMNIHDRQIGEHGGLEGVRDENLLIYAIMRPQNLQAYGNPTIFEMAASLTFGMAKNYPFNDANKRTAYISCRVFLRLNKYDLVATDEDKLNIMLKLSSDKITEQNFAKWLEDNCETI